MEPHDNLGWRLRLVKSPAEQELLRAASAIGSEAVQAVMEACVVGATEAEAAAAGIAIVVAAGAAFHGISISSGPHAHHYAQSQPAPYNAPAAGWPRGTWPASICTARSTGTCSTSAAAGWSAARRMATSGPSSSAVRDTALAGLEAVRPGATVGDVGRTCDRHWAGTELVRRGLATPTGSAAWGHSTSLCWEEPWVTAGCAVVLEPGMCLCIEKRQPVPGVGGANFEETVIAFGLKPMKTAIRRLRKEFEFIAKHGLDGGDDGEMLETVQVGERGLQ